MYQVSNARFFRWRRRRGKISRPPLIFFMFFFTVWPCHRLRRYFHLRLTVCSDKIFFHTAFLISNRYHTKELPTPWLWWPQELHGLMFSILALFCAKSNWKCGSVWQFGSTPLLPLNMRRRLTAFLPLVGPTRRTNRCIWALKYRNRPYHCTDRRTVNSVRWIGILELVQNYAWRFLRAAKILWSSSVHFHLVLVSKPASDKHTF